MDKRESDRREKRGGTVLAVCVNWQQYDECLAKARAEGVPISAWIKRQLRLANEDGKPGRPSGRAWYGRKP